MLIAFHLAGCTLLEWWNPIVQGRMDMREITLDVGGVQVVVPQMGLRNNGLGEPLVTVKVANTTEQEVEIDLRSATLIFARDSALITTMSGAYLFQNEKGTYRRSEADFRPDTLFTDPGNFYFDSDESVIMKEKGLYLLPPGAAADIYFRILYSVPIIVSDSAWTWHDIKKENRISSQASLGNITLHRSGTVYQVPEVAYRRVE